MGNKTCPFCGSPVLVQEPVSPHAGYVGCSNLGGCFMPNRIFGDEEMKQALLEAWNKRELTLCHET